MFNIKEAMSKAKEQASDIIANPKASYAKFKKSQTSGARLDRKDQATVIWYQWENELTTNSKTAFGLTNYIPGQLPPSASDENLKASRSYDISNHIESIAYSKTMGNAAGNFSITLQNSFDWSRFMRPGTWINVYFAGNGELGLPEEKDSLDTSTLDGVDESGVAAKLKSLGTQATNKEVGNPLIELDELPLPEGPSSEDLAKFQGNLRIVGVISRVGIRSSVTADGTVDITYVVTGKDFGAVYEDTEIWFNANDASSTALTTVLTSATKFFEKNLTPLLRLWHDVFLDTKATFKKRNKDLSSFTSFFPEQWLLPSAMIEDLGLALPFGKAGYFGELDGLTEFSPTVFENSDSNPLAGLDGNAWAKLKGLSEPNFHELFTELSDNGKPRIYFRPIPWGFDKSRYPNIGETTLTFGDLAKGFALPPIPIGTNISDKSFEFGTGGTPLDPSATKDIRTIHTVHVTASQVETFDVGPDYHDRYNFFFVGNQKGSLLMQSPYAILSKDAKSPFPMRNEDSIKRHGFKPKFFVVDTFFSSNAANLFSYAEPVFSADPTTEFILETNELIRDFYSNTEDMYSGTITILGDPTVKLGRLLITDGTFKGIPNMAFYIEGYTDNFNVNAEGTTSWMQTLNLTRGVTLAFLNVPSEGPDVSIKDRAPMKTGEFYAFNKNEAQTNLYEDAKDTLDIDKFNPFKS